VISMQIFQLHRLCPSWSGPDARRPLALMPGRVTWGRCPLARRKGSLTLGRDGLPSLPRGCVFHTLTDSFDPLVQAGW